MLNGSPGTQCNGVRDQSNRTLRRCVGYPSCRFSSTAVIGHSSRLAELCYVSAPGRLRRLGTSTRIPGDRPAALIAPGYTR
ncbi:hypothetical protein BZL30_8712 [Mycobacterium kansasii]|uniref:Uncharacterized protein n=1 Tax=Mycobacterium kansasii TaxID=1768 RepID=A0A1V3WGQ6_MYCKA|nr:hypothetical protein BZL30_8712 [Mycobacterium kansasii]